MDDNISLEDVVTLPEPSPKANIDLADRRWECDDTQSAEQISSSLEISLFGLLYAMVKQNSVHKKASIIGLVVDFFLINSFAFSSSFNWGRVRLDAIYVARVFRKGRFTVIWPISLLRTLIALAVTILYIPFLTILTTMLDCRTIDSVFGEGTCFSYPHSLGAIIALIAVPLFMAIAILMTLVYFDPDPLSTSPLARPHSRVDCVYCIFRSILVLTSVLLYDQVLLRGIVHIAITLFMIVFIVIFQPFYSPTFNTIRSALFGIAFCSAVFSVLSLYLNIGEWFPFLWMASLPLGYFIPKILSRMRFNRLNFVDFNDLVNGASRTKLMASPRTPTASLKSDGEEAYVARLKEDIKFTSVTDVEVATRFLRRHVNPKTVLIANHIYQAALDKFPQSSYLNVAYSIF
ncbi:hypothetical protein GEMRC1_002065 [Eukaryota sp. GEM-RC1]